jgi:hypothetical protein
MNLPSPSFRRPIYEIIKALKSKLALNAARISRLGAFEL